MNQLKNQKPNIRHRWVFVTPEMAKKILQNNTIVNRNIKKMHVQSLVSEIKAGEWKPTLATVHFYKGAVTDGRHRLTSIVEADESVWCWFIYDEDNIIKKIDTGCPRRLPDIIKINGIENAKNLVPALSMLDFLLHGINAKQTELRQRPYVNKFLEDFNDLQKYIVDSKYKTGYFNGSILLGMQTYRDSALEFARRVSGNVECSHGTLLYLVRNMLERRLCTGSHMRAEMGRKISTAISLFHQYRNMETKRLNISPETFKLFKENCFKKLQVSKV